WSVERRIAIAAAAHAAARKPPARDGNTTKVYLAPGGARFSTDSLGEGCPDPPTDGSLRWEFDIGSSDYNSPTLDGRGRLYTGSPAGQVYTLDSSTGQAIWDYDAGAPVWTAPAIRPDGSLVVGDTKDQVMLLAAG